MSPAAATLEANLAAAQRALARFVEKPVPHHIGGQPDLGNGTTFDNLAPADNTTLCAVARGDADDIDRAALAARAAFPAWRAVDGDTRRRLLHQIADAIVLRADEIALVESIDTGQPIRYMSKAALRAAENFRFFADRAPGARDGLVAPDWHARELHDAHADRTSRHHHPVEHAVHAVHVEDRARAGRRMHGRPQAGGVEPAHGRDPGRADARGVDAAGLPAGVVNLVHGIGEEAGKALTSIRRFAAVAFVGESATGRAIMAQGAATLKRVHFELGGKNAVIVFADADLDRALDAALFMIYSLNGERCTSSSRALIERPIHEPFVEALSRRVERITVGHPLDPATEIGPLIHPQHVQKVRGYSEIARPEGADVRCRQRPRRQ